MSVVRGFVANFAGVCAMDECETPIEAGDIIERVSSGMGRGYRHVECPEAKDAKPTKFQGQTLEDMGF